MKPSVLIITGYGINAEKELKWAFELAGATAVVEHLEDVIENKKILNSYQIIAIPGGFSFGDHLGSGRVFASIIKHQIFTELVKFIEQKKLLIGICNGFQIITTLGLVPNIGEDYQQQAALIANDSGHFENRWVWCKIAPNNSVWLKGLDKLYLPVRHGEGKFVVDDQAVLDKISANAQTALTYFNPEQSATQIVAYPYNPNGAFQNIAGITNKEGNVLGLMPHPEAYIFPENHPNWTEGVQEKHSGLDIFKNGVAYFK
jgi:phosphoribosylformylglycinamidine synthase